ncbi:Fatty acid synthase 3 [Carabus blaptoides fortunei]
MVSEADIDVVISGIGGSFPKTNNVEELKHALMEQVDLLGKARWKDGLYDVCDKSGNIDNIAYFDASYFGVHQQQATYMDPMQRMVLEKSFEALIDAGINPVEVRGKSIGVYMSSTINENDSVMFENVISGFGVTGQARCMLTNRISYWLNVTGELGCAYADGCLTAEQMILSAYYRGKASQEVTLIPGMMAAIGVGAQDITKECPPLIDVACHNGPDSCEGYICQIG